MKRRTKLLMMIAICLFVIVGVGGLVALKKISAMGGFSYLYNQKHPTKGELPVEYYEDASKNAESEPYATGETSPQTLMISEKLRYDTNGETFIAENKKDFYRDERIVFQLPIDTVPGIYTFRGSYHRDVSSYGIASVAKERFAAKPWSLTTGKLLKSNGSDYWSGNGWTGQPLIIAWPEETKQVMNLYPEKKAKKDFVEVIYPGMDGYIHFLDLEDGSESRDRIHVGMVFKGTCSLYPTGIPLLVLGSGDAQPGPYGENVSPRAYIYSLIDGSKLYEFGANDALAPRVFHAFDSSPIIDPVTDTLIYPSENGVLYTMKLNTSYDSNAGTLSIAPEQHIDYTYSAGRATEEAYTWGMENSAVVNDHYLYVGDNGGVFYCLDLNTMRMVWAQDLKTDINSSPLFSEEADGNFLYVATTVTEATMDEHHVGEVAIYKLNAANGSIVFRKPFECHNVDGVEGGILATGILGKGAIEGQVIYSISRSPKLASGLLISLSKEIGETIWKTELERYGWSSTATMYAESGVAYLIQCLADGRVLLLNASNGYVLDTISLDCTLEATPTVYNNTIVVGTRDRRIVGITVE